MSRRLISGFVAAVVLVAAVLVVFRLGAADGRALVQEEVAGDVEAALDSMATDDMPAEAERLLNTGRPWRAARVMRSFMERADTVTAEHRVLAARAEGGWENWPEVITLLENVSALPSYGNGIGLYFLGRARDATGDAGGAVETYRAFLALSPPAGELEQEWAAAQLRLGLALIKAGDREAARQELETASELAGNASYWFDLLEAEALAEAGDMAEVETAVAGMDSGFRGLQAWRARILAARQSGNIEQAGALADRATTWARTNETRAEFLVAAGQAAIEAGQVAAGRAKLRQAIALGAASPHAQMAASLLQNGQMSADDHLAVARVNTELGLHQEAAEGYRQWLEAGAGTAAQQAGVRLEYAEALFYAERYGEVEAALQPVASRIEAQMLVARAHDNAGNTDEAVETYLAVNERQPRSDTGILAFLLAAAARHDAGQAEQARELYRQFVQRYPSSSYTGTAMMRLAGIAFQEKNYVEAARVWDQHRSSNPNGPLALQATYWSGVAQAERGDTARANALFQSVRNRDRDSYYALLASQRLGEPFWPLPMGSSPASSPEAAQRVAQWMQGIDMLRSAGFPEEASAEADRVVAGAGSDRATLYALAEALAERGYSQRAIQIGLRLQSSGGLNRRLLGILYPFPFRQLISEEARERGLDPAVTAALIRQESMFEARATSHVGARGLMQIMPRTGEQLAESVGIEQWDPELLYHPEINIHLGTRYVAQHAENYDGSLPSIFAAYNAGEHRVDDWQAFPEYGQDELFTERIPFSETREYVKILSRNRALYEGLYRDSN
jgi:soluble lytic murein transglycosylase